MLRQTAEIFVPPEHQMRHSVVARMAARPGFAHRLKQESKALSTQDAQSNSKQMEPGRVNGSVYTARKQHQRVCIRICARAFSVDCALNLDCKLRNFIQCRSFNPASSIGFLRTENEKQILVEETIHVGETKKCMYSTSQIHVLVSLFRFTSHK